MPGRESSALRHGLHQRRVQRPARHPDRAVDDAHILRTGVQQNVLVPLGCIALVGGDKAGGKLNACGTQSGKVSHIGPGVHAARHKHGDAVAELRLIGLYLGQHLRQNLVQCLAGSGEQVLLRKAEMTACLAALNDHKIGGAAELLGPAAQDELCRPPAGNDGRDGDLHRVHKAGQLQRQTRAGHHSVHARFHSGADGGGIVLRGHHCIDGHHTGTVCNLFCLPDLSGQGAVVGAGRVTGTVRLPVACIGGGDAPHAAAGRHGTGQPAQRNAHAHAALQDGHRQDFLSERQHSSLSAWMRCLPPFHRSSRMSATGRTSWSIPAT